MTIPAEIPLGPTVNCTGCGELLPLRVCSSAAGWYIGRHCRYCGPYSRESGYYAKPDDAQAALTRGDYTR